MDKNAIKKYAIWARRELISRVSQRAALYEITDKGYGDASADSVLGRVMSAEEKRQRQALIAQIREKGYEQVMEEIAYTWFNRFIALRFMEVNGYLPSHVRVFTDDENRFKPQILTEAINMELDGLDMEKVYALKNANDDDTLFKYMVIVQCNALSSILPGIFQRIADYTELLFPDNLLREGSVIEQMVSMISEDSFDVSSEDGQIEIIGWLYQYYISEKHEEVVDPLHGKVVKKDEVPAATQLFTTDWVVRYLIDNSVGRYWIERNPNSTLASKLPFFVEPKDGNIEAVGEKVIPQDITVFDPCVGSGHFLIYAFEVLMKIYVEYGYSERDAAAEIVKNNLFGLDIDGRAAQLAYFSVMMKARQYDRRFFSRGIQPHIYEILESNNADRACIEYFCGNDETLKKYIKAILDTLKDSKEFGSILYMPSVDFGVIYNRLNQLKDEISFYNEYLLGDFLSLLRSAEIMSAKYAVVATNPPYLNKYDSVLKSFIQNTFPDYKGDLFSVFMARNYGFCKENGYTCFMTPMVWMFIKTYESLRQLIISQKHLVTLIQFEYSAFEEATVPICAFVTRNSLSSGQGYYFRLSEFRGGMNVQKEKVCEAINNKECGWYYEAAQGNFCKIPGSPIAYWWEDHVFDLFEGTLLSDYAQPKVGLQTGENEKYIRFWNEISWTKVGLNCASPTAAVQSGKKWFPCNKGGEFRRWYGNNNLVVDWENDGMRIKNQAGSYIRNPQFYFKKGMTWSTISSGKLSMRYSPEGFLFETKGSVCFPYDDKNYYYLLGLLNSNVAQLLLGALSPTLDYHEGPLGRIPIVMCYDERFDRVSTLVKENIAISKMDWDSFEQSWDFQSHPLTPMGYIQINSMLKGDSQKDFVKTDKLISEFYSFWEQECERRFSVLKRNEEELNRIFIELYGLQDELTPEVDAREVTVHRADLQRDIKGLLSYAVGCMFGRYSIDEPGLVYAGGDWNGSRYSSFKPDEDAIIPICDDEYFGDDIVGRFVSFVAATYGCKTLEENLRFIADALGGKGPSRDIIRDYFINDFFLDHCSIYSVTGAGKRPIYWLFDSGKKNGFKCLIYMHRYRPDTIARIRTDYVHEQQARYRTAILDLEKRIAGAATSERVKLSKQLAALRAQSEELRAYEEKIHHLADQMISIDLDSGVKTNYDIFKSVLARIK